jgi:outer membrane lipoprotein-sorting protein
LFFIPTSNAQNTVDEIIDYHFDAVKQDRFNKIETMIITAEIVKPGGICYEKTIFKRPKMMRSEITENGKVTVTAFDGKKGWKSTAGVKDTLTGDELKEIEFAADLDGYFYCYRERRHKLSFEGKEQFMGKQQLKIKCEIENDITYVYIDAKSFLFSKIDKMKKSGVYETLLSDYRKVNEIPLPFKFEINTPEYKEVKNVKNIEIDKDIPDSLFTMPAN